MTYLSNEEILRMFRESGEPDFPKFMDENIEWVFCNPDFSEVENVLSHV